MIYGYSYHVILIKMSKCIAFHQRSPGSMDWNTVLLIKNILCDEVIELKTIDARIMPHTSGVLKVYSQKFGKPLF